MKHKKVIGILLILIGIAICTLWFGSFALKIYHRFVTYGYYDSYLEYLWTVGKSDFVLSVFFGSIPAAVGIYFLCKKQACPKGR